MPREYEVNGTVYEFPDDVGDEEAASILQSQGILQSPEFADVQSGGSTRPSMGREQDFAAMLRMRHPQSEFGRVEEEAEGIPALGRGVAQGAANLANVGLDITGVRPLVKGATGRDLRVPSPASVPGEEMGEFIGRQAPTALMPLAKAGPVLSGMVGGAAETGTPKGAATGAAVGGGLSLAARLGKVLFALRGGGAGAVVEKAKEVFPGLTRKVETGKELGRAIADPARAATERSNLERGMRNTIEAKEETAARAVLEKAERGPQKARGAAMAAEERSHTRALAIDSKRERLASQAEKEAAARAQRRQGASMAQDDKRQFEAIVEDRTRERAAKDVIEKARGAGIEREARRAQEKQAALGEDQFREETAHRRAIVENNARERAAAAAEEGGAAGAVNITKPRGPAPSSGENLTRSKPETIDISDGGFIGGVNPKTRTFGLRGPSGERIGGKILDDKIEVHSVGKGSAADSRSAVEAARKLGERTGQPVFIVASEQSESGGKFIQRLVERGELEKVEGGWKLVSRKAANEKVFKAKLDATRASGEVLGGGGVDDLERQLKASLEINKLKGKK